MVPVIVDVGGRDALEESDRMLAALKGEFSTGKKEGEASKGFEKQEAKVRMAWHATRGSFGWATEIGRGPAAVEAQDCALGALLVA